MFIRLSSIKKKKKNRRQETVPMRKYSLKRQIWTISTYGIRLMMRNLIVSDFQMRDGKQHNLAPLTGSPNDGVLLNALKTLFRLSSVLSNLQKCILSGAIKVVSVRSSQGNLNLFEITQGLSIIFPKIFDAILGFTKVRIFLIPVSIAFSNPKILDSLFLRRIGQLGD